MHNRFIKPNGCGGYHVLTTDMNTISVYQEGEASLCTMTVEDGKLYLNLAYIINTTPNKNSKNDEVKCVVEAFNFFCSVIDSREES